MWEVKDRKKVCISHGWESNIVWVSLVNDINFHSKRKWKEKTENIYHKAPKTHNLNPKAHRQNAFYFMNRIGFGAHTHKRVGSLNFALWTNILSNFNKCRILCFYARVCVFFIDAPKLSRALTFSAGHSAVFNHRVYSLLDLTTVSCCLTGHLQLKNQTKKKKPNAMFSFKKNIFQLNSKWTESVAYAFKMQSSRSNVCKHCRRLFCKTPTIEWLGLCNKQTKINRSKFNVLSARERIKNQQLSDCFKSQHRHHQCINSD